MVWEWNTWWTEYCKIARLNLGSMSSWHSSLCDYTLGGALQTRWALQPGNGVVPQRALRDSDPKIDGAHEPWGCGCRFSFHSSRPLCSRWCGLSEERSLLWLRCLHFWLLEGFRIVLFHLEKAAFTFVPTWHPTCGFAWNVMELEPELPSVQSHNILSLLPVDSHWPIMLPGSAVALSIFYCYL